jgi:hypothetical protein
MRIKHQLELDALNKYKLGLTKPIGTDKAGTVATAG